MGKDPKAGNSHTRKEHNNYNPYNTLELNKFHQIQGQGPNKQGHQMHKKKRDLERMIEHLKNKGMEVDQTKLDELAQIEEGLGGRKKEFEKTKRKEFFLSSKYKQIMNIERRKVAKKLKEIKEQNPQNRTLYAQWIKKLNYIKYFPKNLKYISLFPTSPMAEKALTFQNKIIADIQADLDKKTEKLNKFEAEYKGGQKMRPSKKDDFFLQEEGEGEGEEQIEGEDQIEGEKNEQIEEEVEKQIQGEDVEDE